MIATSTDCLSVEELNRLLDGQLSSEEFDSASKHVDECEQCQSRIPEKWDALSPIAKADSEEDSVLAESACQFAVAQLMTANVPVPNTAADLPIDQIGPYEILGQLGQGGMGMVCLARHNRLKRQCAIKLLPPHRVMEPGWLDRFDREMTTVASLEHPGIVRATDAGTHSGWHYLVMEYLDGMDVGKIAHRLGSLPVADACEIARQSAVALTHVHETGLIHRDVKPSNLMLTRDGTVKLLDLGLVLAGDDPLATDDRLTTVGHLMGTLPAMSPEQLLDSRKVQPASDIYSLGATLYRLISGRWPHANEGGLAARVLAITSESNRSTPPPLSSLEPSVETELGSFVGQMMHRQPDQRPSGSIVAERLATWSGDANLKALLKRAESTPASDAPITPLLPLATNPASPPPGDGKHTWTAWMGPLGWFAAAVLLATVVIQIKTDKGLVTVTTDGNDTKVAVEENESPLPTATLQKRSREDSKLDFANTNRDIVYEGKNLDAWLETLASEKEIGAIGRAMRAVERLSRGTSRRAEAAKATLDLTDEYGTWHVAPPVEHGGFMGGGFSSSPPIDRQFMGHLQESYKHYFPIPGVQTIGLKLAHGNQKARIASILQLRNFVMNLNHNTGSPHRASSAEVFFASKSKKSEGRTYIETLLQEIGSASAGLKSVVKEATATSTPHPRSPSEEANIARETAWAIAVRIVQESGPQISPPAWIADYVEEQVDEAVAKYEQREVDPETGQTKWDYADPNAVYGFSMGGFGGGPQANTTPNPPDWILPTELYLAAIEMRREGRVQFPIEFAAETLAHPRFNWYSMDDSSLNDVVQALTAIDPKAPSLIAFHLDRSFQEMDRQYQASQNAEWLHPLTYLQQRLQEGLASVYTTHVEQPAQAHDRLERLVNSLPKLSMYQQSTEDPKAFWHAMLNDLKQRSESE
ncbi:Serine/threonine protein kinase [Rhodopirellula islandica]|uniref:Serine/threonine protein kinase n=1 Tax=Rhodopirellula islandica TaxID=595434 RepID=A0A0J1BMQ5_RHOIS|nr:serine/threonine-protein kinase [Rhodopirellula islandica]KLU07760.1 Serine/threonine protein kinase [Rhodopirellula islandica]